MTLMMEKITPQEELVLQTCKSRAIRDFTLGFCVSSAAVWTAMVFLCAATRRLRQALRFNLSVGSAMFMGMWRFDRSLSTCVHQIPTTEGSRIHRELANIILTKHANDNSKVKLLREHFYQERVFSDLNPDKPIFRWRPRNLYMDSSASQRTESMEDTSNPNKQNLQPQLSSSQSSMVESTITDPLQFIFGESESVKEIDQSDNISVPPRREKKVDDINNHTNLNRLIVTQVNHKILDGSSTQSSLHPGATSLPLTSESITQVISESSAPNEIWPLAHLNLFICYISLLHLSE